MDEDAAGGATGKKEEDEEDETGIEGMFQDSGIAKPSTYNLDLVDSDDELVKSVMVDIDQEEGGALPKRNEDAFWIGVSDAICIMKGDYDRIARYGEQVPCLGDGDMMEE